MAERYYLYSAPFSKNHAASPETREHVHNAPTGTEHVVRPSNAILLTHQNYGLNVERWSRYCMWLINISLNPLAPAPSIAASDLRIVQCK